MRQILLIFILMLLSLASACTSGDSKSALGGLPLPREDIVAGEQAFNFRLRDSEGKEHRLEDFRGKIVLLNFWATWCKPCIVEMPALEALKENVGSEDFVILTINIDGDDELVREFIKKINLRLPVLRDPTMRSIPKFHVEGFPESIFIDRQGRFLAVRDPLLKKPYVRILSDRPWDRPEYVSMVNGLLTRQVPGTPEGSQKNTQKPRSGDSQ